MPRPAPLDGNLHVLRQGEELLERLTDADYRDHAPERSTVGAQYRHVLDHYRCLLAGLESGLVNYDARSRAREIEVNREAARHDTAAVRERLHLLTHAHLSLPLRVVVAAQSHGAPGDAHGSTLGRELLFVLSHTVHHYAIIRLLLEDRGVACTIDFGVAPSTLAYRRAAS
jgi:hypothetical protein